MKVRVYELARELRIQSKDVLQRLLEIGIEGKSSTSTLMPEEVERLKKIIIPDDQKIEEQRVTSRVIRRRHKKETAAKIEEVEEKELKEGVDEAEPITEEAPPPEAQKAIPPIEKEKPEQLQPTPPLEKKDLEKKSIKVSADEIKEAEKEELKRKRPKRRRTEIVKERDYILRAGRGIRKKKKKRILKAPQITTPKAIKRVIKIEDTITVFELGRRMGVKSGEIIKKLMGLGVMATINQPLDIDTATLVTGEFNYEVENIAFEEADILGKEEIKDEGELLPRAPVITVMGHVDHGKTLLLDAIRQTNVIAKEEGGITQHIGAYEVELSRGKVVFLDTPGHEAFTAMRARGAMVTDIVVLVVAADDGVMPQTLEAIDHAREAKVPIIVAINKIDKADANPEKVRQYLSERGLIPEAWGGDTLFCEISAKTKQGIDNLLELILLQAEMLELKGNSRRKARGVIIEAKLDRGRGPVSTALIKDGTLNVGDYMVAGTHHGKVRVLINDKTQRLKRALPSQPVEIIGLSGVPLAGEYINVVQNEDEAKRVCQHRILKKREKEILKSSRVSLEQLLSGAEGGEVKELKVIIKADVQGSLEAIKDALEKIGTEKAVVNIISKGVGVITEGDIMLAAASNALVTGFNTKPDLKTLELAEKEGINIRLYSVIYNIVDDIKKALEGMLEPVYKERMIGKAEVREVFKIRKTGSVGGSYVLDGSVIKGAMAHVSRDSTVVHTGRISSLKRFKDDVKEVQKGMECGVAINGFNDFHEGDTIEVYEILEEPATL